jgi:hypothetical protein
MKLGQLSLLLGCSGRDLNPQAFRHTPLKRTCLPVPPPERSREVACRAGAFGEGGLASCEGDWSMVNGEESLASAFASDAANPPAAVACAILSAFGALQFFEISS